MKENVFKGLQYILSYPEEFNEEKKYPLILFLHGAGTRGESIDILRNNKCFLNLMKRKDERGYILVAPHCRKGDWSEFMAIVLELMENIRELPYVDTERVFVTGNSMGGYGTWEICLLRPEWFAAAMPICGGGIAGLAAGLVDIPIRTFHGLCDNVVDPIESMQMVKAVNKAGGYAELILFPKLNHNCWDLVYSDERNYDWLLSFTTKRDKTLAEQFSGEYYG